MMYTEKIASLIQWAGYAFLGAFLSVFIRAVFTSEVENWGGLFEEGTDQSHHLSRYALLFGTIILSIKFLIGVLDFKSVEDIKNAAQLVGNFDINSYAGASGIAYLLGKSTDGNILSLFGRKS